MPTFIHGIGQCQVIDKSGEIVDLKGHDITSLDKSGTFTWEHQAGTPATLVGKILKAKKIFSKDDCEDERELYYWNKCKTPYLYVMGELLDDYTASAKECAGQMRYSRDNPQQAPLLGFSIEGSELPGTRKGQIITRSIGRKVTLTQAPCNSMCIAEICELPNQKSQVKDDFDELFRSEQEASTLFKSGEGAKMYEVYLAKKEAEGPSMGGKPPKDPYAEYEGHGIRPGKNSSGQMTHSHGNTRPYKFNPAEHQHSGEYHKHSIVTAQNPKLGDNKTGRAQLHSEATASGSRVENRAALSLNDKRKISDEQAKQQVAKSIGLTKSGKDVFAKAEVDSYNFTPDEHKDAAEHHRHAAVTASDEKEVDHHLEQMKAHNRASIGKKMKKSEKPSWSAGKVQGSTVHYSHPEHGVVSIQKQPSGEFHVKHQGALAGVGGVKGSFASPKEAGAHAKKYMAGVSQGKIRPNMSQNHPSPSMVGKSELKKAIEAGSYNAAPSTLVNGAAYQTEGLARQQTNIGEDHNFQATKKKDWNKRAKDDYDRWPHKEKFEKFMKARMPHLADGEIRAIGRVLSLKKSIEMEKSLESLIFGKSESKPPQLKTQVTSKVARIESDPDLKNRETIHLESGHKLEGHPKGKFKVGDEVIAKPHLMGTHLLDHLQKSEKSDKELNSKSLKDIQKETAETWAERAESAYRKAIEEKSVKWLMDADEYFHEAIEHSSLSEDLATFEKIRAKLMPIRKEAIELLVPESKS